MLPIIKKKNYRTIGEKLPIVRWNFTAKRQTIFKGYTRGCW